MINPYNFVRSGRPMPKQPPSDHHRFTGRSGAITCKLQTVTPIFTPASAHRTPGAPADLSFFRINNCPALPGSSMKGMLRSLAEAIANGCSPFKSRQHPPCPSREELCPVCRIFGYLKRGDVHAGQIAVSDALAEDSWQFGPRTILKELSSPKPRHTAFYGAAARQQGRKFYYHQEHVRTVETIPTEKNPTHRNVKIEPLVHGVFRFTVRFWNLGEVELGFLLQTVELPQDLYHKFGMGKPLGLGSVRLEIVGWQEHLPDPADPASRYRRLSEEASCLTLQGLEGQALEEARHRLRERLDPLKHTYARRYAQSLGVAPTDDLWSLQEPNLQDLRVMLSLVPYSRKIRYPDYGWFARRRKEPVRDERLPSIDEVERGGQSGRLPDQ